MTVSGGGVFGRGLLGHEGSIHENRISEEGPHRAPEPLLPSEDTGRVRNPEEGSPLAKTVP